MIRHRDTLALCDDTATGKDTRGAVVCKIELAAGKAPEWLMLFPAPDVDGLIKARDGRVFRMSSPQRFAEQYNADGYEVAFDFDHKVEWGGCAAIGWIKQLEARAGAVWAQVDWLDEGRMAIESRQYRYVSPAFHVDYENAAEVKTLSSAALTNNPALKLPALTSKKGASMDPEMLKLLGLDEKATPEQIAEAVKKLVSAGEAAKVEAEATSAKLRAELAAAQAAQPALDKFVPRSEFDAVVVKCSKLEAEKAEAAKAAHQAAVDAAIEGALKAGKIAPANKDFFVKTCSTAEGLEEFKKFAAGSPEIAPDNVADPAKQQTHQASASTSELDLQVAANLGLSKEQLEKHAKN